MRWNDIEEIAEALEENYPDEEVEVIRLIDLFEYIIGLNDFDDDAHDRDDRILKAIKEAWIEVRSPKGL